jgi:dTDP-4-dehydrorhamnose reductase
MLLGANGQVGKALQRTLVPLGVIEACDRGRVDLASAVAIRAAVSQFRPSIIVNAAAHTAVDRAETEAELAMAVNGAAPGILAEEAGKLDALLVHYSTDYVFDGSKAGAYLEDDATGPLSVYGRSKLAGEQAIKATRGAHLIFRTSWVYGNDGANFMQTMLRLARERTHLRIVDDQIGAPTSSDAIAQATALCVARYLETKNRSSDAASAALSGLYHMSCAGQSSWYGFANAIFDAYLAPEERSRLTVEPIPTEAYPTPARRPRNSLLSNAKLRAKFGVALPDWREALRQVRAAA